MAPRSAPTDSLSRARERAGVRARALRQSSTEAERTLWQHLRNRQLAGAKFRRQHPIGPYFADFACIEACLVVELDGGQHFEADVIAADKRRSSALAILGYTVLRFDNRQMLNETDAVLQVILDHLSARHPHPNPLPQAGEEAQDKETP